MREIARSVEREFASLELGDDRLNRRAKRMVSSLLRAPEVSIPVACGSRSETKAAYRFLSSDVSAQALRAAQADAVGERIRGRRRVLAVQDKTNLDFTCCPGTEGLGPLDSPLCRGLKVQTMLMLDEAGVPLGVIDQQVWAREDELGKRRTRRRRVPEEKESWYWRKGFEVVQERVPAEVEIVGIADRESDIYFVLAMPRREGMNLLVRSAHDRGVAGEEHLRLREAVRAAPVLGTYELKLERTKTRPGRTAKLEVSIAQVVLKPPRHGTNGMDLPPITVSAVWVRERGEVPRGEKRIEWLLLATWPVETLEEALECVRLYAHRWKVERYHFVLKSGCRIERLQLETADRLDRALALYSFVAWRLLWLTYRAREAGGSPCTEALEEEEWKVLLVMGGVRQARDPPTLHDAVRRIAAFGGFQGRKGDGDPGVKAIWQGWRRLMDFILAAQALAQ
ncbi:MAG TPA: IS4 family transposase [Longimicrobiaceae bacterium]|nr:IS4 family transposase [Longimicrobiaceae bacterium]